MTREDTIKVLAVLKAAYPNSYKGMTKYDANSTISIWAVQFANVPVDIVIIAINKLISTNTFPPSISEVKQKLKGMYYEAVTDMLTIKNANDKRMDMLDRIAKHTYNVAEEPSITAMASNIGKESIGEKTKSALLLEKGY